MRWTTTLMMIAAGLTFTPNAVGAPEPCDPYTHVNAGQVCVTTCYVHVVPGQYAVCFYRNFECTNGIVSTFLGETMNFTDDYVPFIRYVPCDPERPPCDQAPGEPARQNIRVCGSGLP